MKKLTALILILMLCFAGCGTQGGGGQEQSTTEPTGPSVPDGVVYVTNAEELIAAFSDLRTDDVIMLGADINMTGKTLAVVVTRGFTLDGNGYTIRNYHVEDESALFVDNAGDRTYVFKNLTLENCSVVSDDDFAALFVGEVRSGNSITVTNCKAVGCTVTGQKYASVFISYTAGGNADTGEMAQMTIENCYAENCNVTGGGSTGIAIGHACGSPTTKSVISDLTIKNCSVTGEDANHEGIIVGTAHIGITQITNVTVESVTLVYNTASGLRQYYGRNIPGDTGSLTIDGAEQDPT